MIEVIIGFIVGALLASLSFILRPAKRKAQLHISLCPYCHRPIIDLKVS